MHGELSFSTGHKIVDKLSMHKTFIYVLSEGQVLHAQGIHLCPVPKDKFSMHKALVYVLSRGHVLHAQGTRLLVNG
jgi:hypothetical protein